MTVRSNTPARLNKSEGFEKTVIVPSASVLTINSVPFTLLAAPVNSMYAICITEMFVRLSAGTAYASLHDLTVQYSSGAVISTIAATGFLDQTTAQGVWCVFDGTSSKGTLVSPATAITLTCGTGDPTTGTSPLTFKIKYKIHRVI